MPDLSSWTFWAGLALAVAVLFGDKLWPLVTKAWSSLPSISPAPKVETDADVLDLLAAKRLQERFKRVDCREGKAAMQMVLAHFFHEPDHVTPATPPVPPTTVLPA